MECAFCCWFICPSLNMPFHTQGPLCVLPSGATHSKHKSTKHYISGNKQPLMHICQTYIFVFNIMVPWRLLAAMFVFIWRKCEVICATEGPYWPNRHTDSMDMFAIYVTEFLYISCISLKYQRRIHILSHWPI